MTQEPDELLIFVGTPHQSCPGFLIWDPFLSDSAKLHYLYLSQGLRKRRGEPLPPSSDKVARELGHSPQTAQRDRTLLRICRWISEEKQDPASGYAPIIIHEEPCPFSSACRLDSEYMKLLQSGEQDKDPYIRRAAQATQAHLHQMLEQGQDPLEPPDCIVRRLNSAEAIRNGSGVFFDIPMPQCDSPT